MLDFLTPKELVTIVIVGSAVMALLSILSFIILMLRNRFSEGHISSSNTDGLTTKSTSTSKSGFIGKSTAISGSMSMEMWDALMKVKNGKLAYLPIIIFSVAISSFSFSLLLFFVVYQELSPTADVILIFFILSAPYFFFSSYYKSYKRVKNK